MRQRVLSAFLLSSLFVAVLPAAAERALVFVDSADKADVAAEARTYSGVVRELPNAIEVDSQVAGELAGRALRVEILPDPNLVQLSVGEVDLRRHPLTKADLSSKTPRPMVVAFDAVADQNLSDLVAAGAEVVGTLPPAAFLVRASGEVAGRLAKLEGVAALAHYETAWKASPRQVSGAQALGPLATTYEVVLYAGASESAVDQFFADTGIAYEVLRTTSRAIYKAELSDDEKTQVADLAEVEQIDIAPEPDAFNNEVRVVMQTDKAHFQANQAFYNPVYGIGVWGASQIVTLADTGLQSHEVFAAPLKSFTMAAANSCLTALDALDDFGNHGTGVAATLLGDKAAGSVFGTANDLDGVSLRSQVVMQDIESDTGVFCPPTDTAVSLFFPAWTTTSMVHSNSWGHNGAYGSSSLAGTYSWRSQRIDEYMSALPFREQSILFAVGNAGGLWNGTGINYVPYTLSDEAHSKDAIAVGGSRNGLSRDIMYSYSSRGPTNDCQGVACAGIQRVKPDVVAPASSQVDTADTASYTAYSVFNGTSIAAPAVAGAVALVRDYFAQGKYPVVASDPVLGGPPSSALVKAMLVNSTLPLYDTSAYQGNVPQGLPNTAYPNYDQGYGRPTLDNVLEPAGYRKLKVFEDATTTSKTGDVWQRTLTLQQKWAAKCNNLRVTLAWNDPMGTLGAGPKLVNDLDLEVVWNGTTVRGNHLLTGGAWDKTNNVEDVFLAKGYYQPWLTTHNVVIRVYGTSVRRGPQPWAVVLTYGTCADELPCPPPPVAGGCYRGPGDVVPGSTWVPPVPGCKDQTYGMTEYNGSLASYPRCEPPPHVISVPTDPVIIHQP